MHRNDCEECKIKLTNLLEEMRLAYQSYSSLKLSCYDLQLICETIQNQGIEIEELKLHRHDVK